MPPWNMTAQTTFENTVAGGKGASLIHWGAPFTSPAGSNYAFDTGAADNVRNHGSISVYDWAPYRDGQGPNQSAYSLGAVIAGQWDSYITAWFQSVKAWGHPIMLRWAWEMNIQAWPWSEGINGNTAGQYVQAWKHVHDIATSIGVTDVSWVWCPNNSPSNNYAEFYPGNAYVDWTCVDGYNWGTDPNGHKLGWQTFDQVFHSAYQAILAIAPTKPMMIGEVGVTEYGGSKATWITDMLTTELPVNYRKIEAFMYFDCNYGPLWPIESSTSAEQAFANGIGSSYYDTNRFGSASTSPIPPP
jgi:beta-mannanase